jgi:hypothetical protein
MERWVIPAEYRQALVNKLIKIVLDPASTPHEQISAMRVLVSAEAQNQKDEQHWQIQDDRHRFIEVAKRLGVDASFRHVEPPSTGDGSESPD